MIQRLEPVVERIAMGLAIAGGGVLLAIVALTCVSIAGRVFVPLDIGIGPIRGIYDITEIGMAAAVFAFLPWTQLREAHATVDLFQSALPGIADRVLQLLFHAGMLAVAGFGTWRLYLGMLDKHAYGETTIIAGIPVWLGYLAGLMGAVGFVLVAAFCVLRAGARLAHHAPSVPASTD